MRILIVRAFIHRLTYSLSLTDLENQEVITKLTIDYMYNAKDAWLYCTVRLLLTNVLEDIDTGD